MKKFILTLMLALLCSTANAMEKIDMSVQDLIIQPQGETTIYTNNWSNDKLSLQLRLTWIGCLIRVTNNTDQPMLLSWNKSAMVDIDGNSHRLMPGETRKLFSAQSIPETMIPPHTSYAPMAVADGYYVDNAVHYKLLLDYPTEKGLFGNIYSLSSKKSKKYMRFAQKYTNRNLSMILCLNINGQDEYYNFNLALDFYKSIGTTNADGTIEEPIKPIPLGWNIEQATIKSVTPDGMASKVGLAVGDVILEINGKAFAEVENPQQFIETRFAEGRTVMVLVSRDGNKKMITLKKD